MKRLTLILLSILSLSAYAQLTGLSAAEANGTCAALARHKTACIVLKPEAGQLARG